MHLAASLSVYREQVCGFFLNNICMSLSLQILPVFYGFVYIACGTQILISTSSRWFEQKSERYIPLRLPGYFSLDLKLQCVSRINTLLPERIEL